MINIIRQSMGTAYVIPVGRAALGIYAAIIAWTQGKKALVAVPASVCQDVLAAILMSNCQPVFCDTNPITGLCDKTEWQKAKASGATIAIVVHLYGNPADTASIRSVFPQPECLLIDDAAQALGTHTSSGIAGSEGDIGVISFGATKHIEVGGGALLIHNKQLAQHCQEILSTIHIESDEVRRNVQTRFRQGYNHARELLVSTGDNSGFAGLLHGYAATIKVPWQDSWAASITQKLIDYPQALALRQQKSELWQEGITGTGLRPVGMNTKAGCAPWRFASRWVNCHSFTQLQQLGESLRTAGLHVSHWYLPAHWWLNNAAQRTVGSEALAYQALQFWLDESTSFDQIRRWIPIIRLQLEKFSDTVSKQPTKQY